MIKSIIRKLLLTAIPLTLVIAYADGPYSPGPKRKLELMQLLKQDCGACHGMRLLGGLGPALTPAQLHDKPNAFLAATILEGRAGTPMPPWKPFLSPNEADWLATLLKQGVAE